MRRIGSILCLMALCVSLWGCAAIAPAREYEMLVRLDAELTDVEERSIGGKILALEEVIQSRYIHREQLMAEFTDDISVFDTQVIGGRYQLLVRTADPNALVKELEQIPGVEKVSYYKIPDSES